MVLPSFSSSCMRCAIASHLNPWHSLPRRFASLPRFFRWIQLVRGDKDASDAVLAEDACGPLPQAIFRKSDVPE